MCTKAQSGDVRVSLKGSHSPLHRVNCLCIRLRLDLLNAMGQSGAIFQLRCWVVRRRRRVASQIFGGRKNLQVSLDGVEQKDTFLG